MFSLRTVVSSSILASTFVFSAWGAHAQTAAVQKSLEAKIARTKTTADRSDIVTAGDVVVLQKDGLLMCSSSASSPVENTYKNGKVSAGALGALKCHAGILAGPATLPSRKFVSGEKFWVTSIDARGDSVVIGVFSDPISDTRYYGTIKIPTSPTATPDEVGALVDQVIKVQPADDAPANNSAKGGSSAPAPSAPAAPAAPAPTPVSAIAPPPPPADAPPPAAPTLKIGMTKDQVIAMMGQPTMTAKVPKPQQPSREIYTYPNLKITFVKDKVTDIQ